MPARTKQHVHNPRIHLEYRHPAAKQLAQKLDDLDFGPPRQPNPDYSPEAPQKQPRTLPNELHAAGDLLLNQYLRASREGQDWLAPRIEQFVVDPAKTLQLWRDQG